MNLGCHLPKKVFSYTEFSYDVSAVELEVGTTCQSLVLLGNC